MGFVVSIVLISGCVSIGGEVLNVGDDSTNFTEVDESGNITISAGGVSFKCPYNWFGNVVKDGEKTSIAVCQSSNSSFQPQFMVDITPNNGMSEQEAIDKVEKDIFIGYKKVSSSIITIDGNNAYESIFTVNDPVVGQIKSEYIYFVKNGKTYVITFSAVDKDFDKEKGNFDIILYSFKVQ